MPRPDALTAAVWPRSFPRPPDEAASSSLLSASSSPCCWKCRGHKFQFQKSTKHYDGAPCKVCHGVGIRPRSKRARELATQDGRIIRLRGYPPHHPLRRRFPTGFAGPLAYWGRSRRRRGWSSSSSPEATTKTETEEDDAAAPFAYVPAPLQPQRGEVVGALGCGDWRLYQIAAGNKLTVDDFVCAWVAAEEVRKRGYGGKTPRLPLVGGGSTGTSDAAKNETADQTWMFGENAVGEETATVGGTSNGSTGAGPSFHHADLGTGCGSVLLMLAWAFGKDIASVGIEAQSVSFQCARRGLEWNLGRDGSQAHDRVQLQQQDLRTWDGCRHRHKESTITKNRNADEHEAGDGVGAAASRQRPSYQLITGTPPYFPLDSFVASPNHPQKVRCRMPTRGRATEYIAAASRLLHTQEEPGGGIFVMVEAAFATAEAAVLAAVVQYQMTVLRRVDVVTRCGLAPRFSCWVMTTTTNHNTTNSPFPVEIFTLRDSNLKRTHEYTRAMEAMGWVDFEKYKD